ncbi:hypothetical protein BKA66DRAFT_435022 [Pyrenochaeta sp. MPI-SDFR-AT-0127]|nr:hypothetical protein BKA66DRAFT_435022 [Pyrenochaeta sp. MPI-SDFR-AT-0127]
MSAPTRPLEVIIVGAGLAGALAARVLRENHNVRIYECKSTPQEAGSLPVGATKVFNKEGKLVLDKHSNYAEVYGADWLFHHRADLRAEFLRLATADSGASGIPGRPAEVHWGTGVVDVDPDKGKVILSSGEEISADLIVASDGIKSVIRPHIVGDAAYSTARPSGLSAFRFTLGAEMITKKLGETPEILKPDMPVCLSMVYSFDGSMRSVVMYPCRDFQLLNFVCIVPDSTLKQATSESWSATGDPEELLSAFSDFPSWVLGYLRLATEIKLWQLRDQDPLPTYVRGRTVLIGDAAHAMTPHQGQGGTQAVEDAEGFRLFLQPGVTRETVPELLRDFDSVRRPRASQIQNNTRKAHDKRTAEEVYMFERINWTYYGIIEELRRIKEEQELPQV